ncbi:MAG: sulfurtransferase [Gammaproteobacteria bacterium]
MASTKAGRLESPLIGVRELAAALSALPPGEVHARAPWVVVDCRFNLLKPDAGRAAYLDGHIPGAWYADLDRDLSSPPGPLTGRHPLPEPEQLRLLFGRFGIGPESRVVAYDEGGGGIAARLWWLLRWMGHRSAYLLDGGLAAWQKAGLSLSQAIPDPQQRRFVGEPGHMPVLTTEGVAKGLSGQTIQLLDVRAEERFLGRVEPIDPVAGHVPGAANVPFAGNLDADQRFQAPEALGRRYAPLAAGHQPADIVCMCGSGVTACHGILALELAGVPGAALYAGSWSEWIRSPDRPVATSAPGPATPAG